MYMICMCIRVHTYRCHKRTGGPSTCQARSRTWRRRAPSDAQVCLICLPYVSALYVCLMCLPSACLMCLPHVSALHVCLTCLPSRRAPWDAQEYMSYVSALYVLLICLPYASALYVWRGPAASAIARLQSIPRGVLDEAINNIHAQRAGSNTPRVQSGSFLRSVLDAVRRDAGLPPNEAFAVSPPACLLYVCLMCLVCLPCACLICRPQVSSPAASTAR